MESTKVWRRSKSLILGLAAVCFLTTQGCTLVYRGKLQPKGESYPMVNGELECPPQWPVWVDIAISSIFLGMGSQAGPDGEAMAFSLTSLAVSGSGLSYIVRASPCYQQKALNQMTPQQREQFQERMGLTASVTTPDENPNLQPPVADLASVSPAPTETENRPLEQDVNPNPSSVYCVNGQLGPTDHWQANLEARASSFVSPGNRLDELLNLSSTGLTTANRVELIELALWKSELNPPAIESTSLLGPTEDSIDYREIANGMCGQL